MPNKKSQRTPAKRKSTVPDFVAKLGDLYDKDQIQAAVRHWEDVLEHLASIGYLNANTKRIAEALVLTQAEADRLEPSALEEGPTKSGKNGGEYASMTWAAVRNLRKDALKYQEVLLIAPQKAGGANHGKKKPAPEGAKEFLG